MKVIENLLELFGPKPPVGFPAHSGRWYLSKGFNNQWMQDHGFRIAVEEVKS